MNTTEYLTGARPVVGTMGACGLMLLACSWFVLGPGDLGRSREVGTPAPVHIGTATGEQSVGGALHRTTHHVSARPDVAAKATIAPARRKPGNAVATTQIQSSSTAPAASSPAAAPTTPGVPATQPASELPPVTPTLPAPMDDTPEVTLPPVSAPQVPAVPLPAVPLPAVQLPDVSATTTQLGLP